MINLIYLQQKKDNHSLYLELFDDGELICNLFIDKDSILSYGSYNIDDVFEKIKNL